MAQAGKRGAQGCALAIGLLMAASPPTTRAQVVVTAQSSAQNGLSCAADRAGTTFNCTAGEFTTLIQFASASGAPTQCDAGGTFTTSIIAELNGTNADRYDGGIFVGQNANSPREFGGTCSVASFPLTSSPTPPRTLGFANIDGDACGDYRANGVENWQVNNVQISCSAGTSGQLMVPYLLTYQQNNPGICSGPASPLLFPGTKAKCNSGIIPLAGVAVQGWVDVTKQTTPDGSPQSFTFSVSGAGAQPTTFTLTDGQTQRVRIPLLGSTATSLTITETATTGWATTAQISCTGPDGTSSASGYVSTDTSNRRITANLTNVDYGARCTITNNRLPTLQLVKSVINDNGGTAVATDWTLSAAGPTAVGNVASGTTRAVTPGVYTLSESAGPAGYTAGTYSCSKNGGAAVSGNTLSLAFGDVAVCTITNNDQPATLTLVKQVVNDNGGIQASSAWTLSATGPTTISGTTGTGGVTNAVVNAGTYVLAETGPANYVASGWSCSAGVLSGSTLTLANGQTATCTITNNDSNEADLSITKTSSPAGPLAKGSTAVYTLVVSNAGPATATGAVVKDTPVSGLTCPAAGTPDATCSSATAGACPSASFAASTLTGSGVTLGTMPAGSSVTLEMTCTVN